MRAPSRRGAPNRDEMERCKTETKGAETDAPGVARVSTEFRLPRPPLGNELRFYLFLPRPPRYPAEPRTLTLGVADGWGRPPCEAAGWRKDTPVSCPVRVPHPTSQQPTLMWGPLQPTPTAPGIGRPSVRRKPANLEASARVPCPHRALPLVAGALTRRQRQARVNAPPAMAMAHMSDGEIGTATGRCLVAP